MRQLADETHQEHLNFNVTQNLISAKPKPLPIAFQIWTVAHIGAFAWTAARLFKNFLLDEDVCKANEIVFCNNKMKNF